MTSLRFSAALCIGLLAGAAAFGSPARAVAGPYDDAAKKEGVVVWYATMNTKDLDETAAEFMRLHPGIKVEALRLGSSQLPARIVTEQRGGKFNADVISGDDFQVSQLVDVGAFDKYPQPEASSFLKGTVDPNGYWTNLYQNTTVIAWNPARLAADHLKPPTSNADFAKPEWKGKFGFDTGALNWYMGMLQHDKTGGSDLATKIANNQPVKTSGHTQTLESIETGEIDAAPTVYGYNAFEEKKDGKPIDYVNPNPVLLTLTPVGLAKNAPHPNAAKVLIDWLTSKEGQTYIVNRGGGEVSSRTDVKNNPAIFDPSKPYFFLDTPTSAQYNDLEHQFRTLFGLPG
jgi:iron(III) transport system substrate-binding protein